jgi:hypothetical protein
VLVLVLCIAGVVGMKVIAKRELWRQSLFYDQFVAIEPSGIAIIAAFAFAVLALLTKPAAEDKEAMQPAWLRDTTAARWTVILGVLLITVLGTHLVFNAYPFVDDEYSGVFQGIIYSGGHRTALVAAPWCRWIAALTPTSIAVPEPCTWQLSYFPVHAMIRGVFHFLRSDSFAEPVMSALSVLLIFQVARRAWPDRPQRATLSALFLAASTQFLVMTMSAFSMPAHLLASIAWLWLYVRPERWALVLLPWLGVLALGVHSPYPHVLFVAPLVLSFLFRKRFIAFAYISVVYIIGSLAWVGRLYPEDKVIAPASESADRITGTVTATFAHPAGDGITASLSTTVLATWNVPIAILAVIVALLMWKRLDTFARWLAVSFLTTIVLRAILSGTYGAGWGHRYAFAVLGNMAILAAIGAGMIGEAIGHRRAYKLLAAAFIAALCIQLPLRGLQARRIVQPYYQASKYLESIDADVVVVPFDRLIWGRQLLRNDPFLRNRPKLMGFAELKQVGLDSLRQVFPGRVRVITRDELERFGIRRASRIGRFEVR